MSPFKILAADGKMRFTDVADPETILYIGVTNNLKQRLCQIKAFRYII